MFGEKGRGEREENRKKESKINRFGRVHNKDNLSPVRGLNSIRDV